MLAVIITGPPGSGKSTAATGLHDGLGSEGIDNALIEVDELERSYPPTGPERALRHLALLSASYREMGPRILTVTATVEDADYMSALFTAIGTADRFVVRLEANPETLAERIRDREPADWDGLDELIEASADLAGSMPTLTRVDLVLNTDSLTPDETVSRIRDRLPVT